MRRLRLSIEGLIVLVGFAALALAALLRPTPGLASWCFTLALAASVLSLVGMLYARGGPRDFRGGYALASWCYLVVIYAPWFGENVAPRLVTDGMAASLYRQVRPAPRLDDKVLAHVQGQKYEGTVVGVASQPGQRPMFRVELAGTNGLFALLSAQELRVANLPGYKQTLDSLFAIASGLLGGILACLFSGRGRSPEGPP